MTPTARTLQHLRKLGFIADVVERRLPRCFITRDAFGFGDILAARPGVGIVLIQATGGSGNFAKRKAKILAEPRAVEWIASGGRIEVWGWNKQGPRGKRKTWTLRREDITFTLE